MRSVLFHYGVIAQSVEHLTFNIEEASKVYMNFYDKYIADDIFTKESVLIRRNYVS